MTDKWKRERERVRERETEREERETESDIKGRVWRRGWGSPSSWSRSRVARNKWFCHLYVFGSFWMLMKIKILLPGQFWKCLKKLSFFNEVLTLKLIIYFNYFLKDIWPLSGLFYDNGLPGRFPNYIKMCTFHS